MKLAVNYLNEVRELFEEGKIDFVDYFKLYSIDENLSGFDWCAEHRNVMFHGFIGNGSNLGDDDFWGSRDVEKQKDYYTRGNTPYTSMHINRTGDEVDSEEVTFEKMKKNVQLVKDDFGMDTLLENVPARYQNRKKDFISSPEFISKLVYETDSYFLFDIGHARVAADVLGIPFDEYVDRLPMDRVVEMHLAGTSPRALGGIRPTHKCMNEEDYKFLEEAVKKYKTLKTITLEYGPAFYEEGEINNYPVVSFDKFDPIAKKEVYEQLLRIKEIIGK